MTDCNPHSIAFPHCKGRLVEASFSGGAITSDGGAVLLREADRMSGLTDRAARSLTDTRRKASCRHSLLTMVRQRVYALALGYEDPDDHDELRSDRRCKRRWTPTGRWPALQPCADSSRAWAGTRRCACCCPAPVPTRYCSTPPRPNFGPDRRNARPAFHMGGPGPGSRSSPIRRSLPRAGKTARKSWPGLWKPYRTVRFPAGRNHQVRTGLENRGFGGESTHSCNIRVSRLLVSSKIHASHCAYNICKCSND